MIDSTNPMKEVPEVAFLKKEKKRLVFCLDKSASEIVELLEHPRFEDNIKYTFEKNTGTYTFAITKIPYQLGKHRPVNYRLWFEQGKTGNYLLIEAEEEKSLFVTSNQEPEIYRFFIQVCGCEPVVAVE